MFTKISHVSGTKHRKILNDPIYGFITIPNSFLFDIVEHRYFQRLRRISQMGLSYLVFPGAHHTRFHHALGAMHMMEQAINVLKYKGVSINDDECNALMAAILLHDIGHGPFSHAMEHSIVNGVSHEEISLFFMNKLNDEMNGQLSLAIKIFKGEYHRLFMLQLISSQLDMDRMDYLKRDSFYTGVAEGNINSDRLIQMLNVVEDRLVIEEKGIYSVEKFLMARRLMYWQVYLHKTSLVSELILTKILKRARALIDKGKHLAMSNGLLFFMKAAVNQTDFDDQALEYFSQLDDFDIISAIKSWQYEDDFILSSLSKMIINRDLLKIKMSSDKFSKDQVLNLRAKLSALHPLNSSELSYFIFRGTIKNQAYSKEMEPIRILKKDGSVEDVAEASDQLSLKALSKPVTKFYICFPKQLREK